MVWEVDSNTFGDFIGTVERSVFETDERYRDGNIPILRFQFGNLEVEDGSAPDTWNESYPVGKDWEVVDDGGAVENTKRPGNTKFHESTKAGMLVSRVVSVDGLFEEIQKRGTEPTEAASYLGIRAKWEVHEHTYEFDDGPVTVEFLLPTEFVGTEDVSVPAATTNGGGSEVDIEALEDELNKLAGASDSFDEFREKALKVEGVLDTDELLERVVDEGESGLYATAAA